MKSQALRTEVFSSELTNGFVTVTIGAAGRTAVNQLVLRTERTFIKQVIPGRRMMAVTAGITDFTVLLNALAGLTMGTYYVKIQVRDVAADKAVCFMMRVLTFPTEHGMDTRILAAGFAFRNVNSLLAQRFQSGSKRAKFCIYVVLRSKQHPPFILSQLEIQVLAKNMAPVITNKLIQPEPGIGLFVEDLLHLEGSKLRMKEMNEAITVLPDFIKNGMGFIAQWFFKHMTKKVAGFVITD